MNDIKIHEVGLRDGLQMEPQTVPLEQKIQWADSLIASGVDILQLGSFVNPARMPQMADTDDFFRHYLTNGKPTGTILSGLVLNEKGLDRGMECGVDMFCMGVSASETHSTKNTGKPVDEALDIIIKMADKAIAAGKKVQVSVQSAFGCGFEGKISEDKVLSIVKKYVESGIKNISLADTAGHANPAQVERLFKGIHAIDPTIELTCHFHNTYGVGLLNCWVAMANGVKYIETAFGGLGGCPFTKLAAGNVCTEDFVHMLQRIGMRTEVNNQKIIDVTKEACGFFGKELPGFVYKSGGIKY